MIFFSGDPLYDQIAQIAPQNFSCWRKREMLNNLKALRQFELGNSLPKQKSLEIVEG